MTDERISRWLQSQATRANGYRELFRPLVPLSWFHMAFLSLILLGGSTLLEISYFVLLIIPALFLVGFAEVLEAARSWTLRICFIYLLHMLLTPLWTFGVGTTHWISIIVQSAQLFAFVAVSTIVFQRDDTRLDSAIRRLSWIALASGALSIIIFYAGHSFAERFVALPWTNPNTGPAVFGVLVAGLVGSATTEGGLSSTRRMTSYAIALFLLGCILLAGTRSALVALAVSAFGCLMLTLPRNKSLAIAFGSICLVFAGVALLFPGLRWNDDSGRLKLLLGFWEVASQHFWLGHGIQNQGNFKVTVLGISLSAPHNMLLTALLYGGVPAVLLLSALYIALILVGVRHYHRSDSLALFAIAVFLVVHGMFETIQLASPAWSWLYIWFPVGAAAGIELQDRQRPSNGQLLGSI